MRTLSFIVFVNYVCLCAHLTLYTVFANPIAGFLPVNVTDCPRIVSRAEWKARKARDHEDLPFSPTPYVVIHHGGIPKYCFTEEECSAQVRSYQNLHLDDRNWFDIGYNFVIGEDGNAFHGRGWNYVGAHAPGYNTQSIGICVIGDFTKFTPNQAALNTLNALIACGVSRGKIAKDYKLIGHRQARNTECPGESFYEYVVQLPHWTAHPVPIYSPSTTTVSPRRVHSVETYGARDPMIQGKR